MRLKYPYAQVPGIYFIVNKTNGKFYIGSSNNIRKRITAHVNELNRNRHNNQRLQNAWNKYGEKSFEFIHVSSILDKENICSVEQYFLDEFKTHDRNIGYNISPVAQNYSGYKQSEGAILKRKEIFKGENNPFYGKFHSADTKRYLSEIKKGKNTGENNPFYGKKHSQETIDKIKKSKRILRFVCEQTCEIFESSGGAAKNLNIKQTDICSCLYGRQKSTKGYTFRFLKENEVPLDKKPFFQYTRPKKSIAYKGSLFLCEQTGDIFEYTRDVADRLNIPQRDVCNCLSGRQKTTRGYSFRYLKQDEIKTTP